MVGSVQQLTEEARDVCGEIEHRAYALLDAHVHFHGRAARFQLACREDVLVVRGAVPTYYLKQLLQTVLRGVDGVRRVDNQVTVLSIDTGD